MKKLAKEHPYIKTAMRLPADLHAELRDAAGRAGHSMNVEIINRLSASAGGVTLTDIANQNAKTQEMVQQIIDAISPRR